MVLLIRVSNCASLGAAQGPRSLAIADETAGLEIESRYVAEPLGPEAAEAFERSCALSEQVQREDMDVCRAVQQGLRSSTYRQGRYSVLRENGVHHFHGLLSRFLAD